MTISDYFVDLNKLSESGYQTAYDLGDSFWNLFDNSLITKGAISANIVIENKLQFFSLTISVKGTVSVPCDRCLDDVEIPIERTDKFIVRLGETDDYSEDLITINREDGMLDIATLIYEACALSLPIVCRHEDGKCNAEMMKILKDHMPDREDKLPDSRWDALKDLKQ